MKKSNAGFSLVELIVVVTAMVIILGVGGNWISRISGYRARECCSKITSSLTQAKVQSMSKTVNLGDVYWKLEKEGNLYYVTTHTPTSEEKIKVSKSASVKVNCLLAGTNAEVGSGVDALFLAYKRSTGAIYIGLDDDGDGTPEIWSTTPAPLNQISVTNGPRTYTIEIAAKTGKVSGRN